MENTEARIAALEASLKNMVYEYVCRSLFKVIHTITHRNRTNVVLSMSKMPGIGPLICIGHKWVVTAGFGWQNRISLFEICFISAFLCLVLFIQMMGC